MGSSHAETEVNKVDRASCMPPNIIWIKNSPSKNRGHKQLLPKGTQRDPSSSVHANTETEAKGKCSWEALDVAASQAAGLGSQCKSFVWLWSQLISPAESKVYQLGHHTGPKNW